MVETLGSYGVPEVVATKWQIDSEAAVPFMDAFYANLANGSTVAMALTGSTEVTNRDNLSTKIRITGGAYICLRKGDHLLYGESYMPAAKTDSKSKRTKSKTQSKPKTGSGARLDVVVDGPMLFVPEIEAGKVLDLDVYSPTNGHPVGAVFLPRNLVYG